MIIKDWFKPISTFFSPHFFSVFSQFMSMLAIIACILAWCTFLLVADFDVENISSVCSVASK